MTHRRTLCAFTILAALGPAYAQAPAPAPEGPQGIVVPTVFAPFDPEAPVCTPPPGLTRELVFVQDNAREFIQGVAHGISLAAAHENLAYSAELADNDASLMVRQVEALRARKVGAVIAAPVDAPSLSLGLQRLIWSGSYVGTVVPPPATTLLNAPQYLTGRVLAQAAAAYIRDALGGRARVVLLTHDSLQFLAPRFVAMRDELNALAGVSIVADISPLTVDEEGGRAMMENILLAHPDVDVVLGADTVVLGALAAVRAAGKERREQFFGGIDGEPEAIAEIKRGGTYRATVGLASPVFGYAMGRHAGEWLAGRSIPQAMDILPRALTIENIDEWEADLADPAQVYADPQRRAAYLKMYGNICYDTRENYVNFPWSSERP